jgi:carboxyl-terminal processing protease
MMASFVAGANSGQRVNLKSLGINILSQDPPREVTTVDYSLLWKVLEEVSGKYVDRPVNQQELMYGAVQGLVRALGDPHSVFLPPEDSKRFKEDLDGNFEGIGAEISIRDEQLIVVAPLPGTPAERAGLRPQDIILKIDGEEFVGMSLDDAVNKIRGPGGTTVVLTVLHKDATDTEEISIVRDSIHIESVRSEVKEVSGKRIGVISLMRFGPDTRSSFESALNSIGVNSVDGLIVDVRNNPGGLLDSAIDVASFWLKSNQVTLKEVDADKREFLYYAKGPGQLAGKRTVVLINEGSASASEILAGALQDYGLATVVGEKSFGKGSVQDLIDLADNSSLKITIAKWLTPNGRSIEGQGIEPDVVVEMTREDYEQDRDPQMDRGIEILTSQ